jgi:hypothetical protein
LGKLIIFHLGGVIPHPGEFLPPGELHIPYTFRTYFVNFRTHSVHIPYKFCTSAHTPYRRSTSPPGKTILPPSRGVFQSKETSYFPPGEYLIRGDTTYPQVYTLYNEQCNTKAIRINKFNKNKNNTEGETIMSHQGGGASPPPHSHPGERYH